MRRSTLQGSIQVQYVTWFSGMQDFSPAEHLLLKRRSIMVKDASARQNLVLSGSPFRTFSEDSVILGERPNGGVAFKGIEVLFGVDLASECVRAMNATG